MRNILILCFSLFFPAVAVAGWFGPNDYNSCILESMKGITSDVAARAIKQSCREKFPEEKQESKELPESAVQKLEGSARMDTRGDYICTIFNGNNDWAITSLEVRITDEKTSAFKDYKVDKTSVYTEINGKVFNYTLGPLARGDFSFKPFQFPKEHTWVILKAYGIAVSP
jgi:hypothetical protein